MKTREDLIDAVLRDLGSIALTGGEKKKIDDVVDRYIASRAAPNMDNRYKIKVGAFHLPKTAEMMDHIRCMAETAANEALGFALEEGASFLLRIDEGKLKGAIWLPLGVDDDYPEWTVDIEGEFREVLENRLYQDTSTLDAGDFEFCKGIRDRLAAIVALYDGVLNKGVDRRLDRGD